MRRAKVSPGYTFDTGVLIGFERRRRHIVELVRRAVASDTPIHISTAVVAEFWRGKVQDELATLITRFTVRDTLERAKLAGIALGKVPKQPRGRGPGPVDALVAALAAEMGDIVVTADPDDIATLRPLLPGIAGIVSV